MGLNDDAGRATGSLNWSDSRKSLTTTQMLEDFRCLFETTRDNYPFLWSKARYEGYDWLTHEPESKQSILQADTDRQFARAIYRMVRLLNNGHTTVAGESGVRSDLGNPAQRWVQEARKTTPEKAAYWAAVAGPRYESGWFTGREPFAAVYNAGEYVVVGVSPTPVTSRSVSLGSRVVAINGQPVHEFVARQRGESWLKYDPLRGRVYMNRLLLPQDRNHLEVELSTAEGSIVNADLPALVEPWPDPYCWPPQYEGHASGSAVYASIIRGRVGYVQLRQMSSNLEDAVAIRTFLKQAKDLPALVIDIRGNWGGSDLFWIQNVFGRLSPTSAQLPLRFAWRSGRRTKEFLESKIESLAAVGFGSDLLPQVDPRTYPGLPVEIRSPAFGGLIDGAIPLQPTDSINYRGRVFVLVDDGVFSAAETFAAFCKASGWATLVGECTGGDGIGFDPSTLTLPNSGMYILYSTTLGLNPDWSVNEQVHTRPDVLVERAPEDLLRYLRVCAAGPLPGPDPLWDTTLRECLRLALGA